MIYLSDLSYRNILEDIANKHPILIYFICFRNDPEKFPNSRFFDWEKDCEVLDKFGLIEYKPRSERKSHDVTEDDCRITRDGKNIYNEMVSNNICQKIFDLLNTGCEMDDFVRIFQEKFTFNERPDLHIQNILNEIEKETTIPFAKNGYSKIVDGNIYKIKFLIENNIFYLKINIKCTCSNELAIDIEKNTFVAHLNNYYFYELQCDSCNKVFQINPDLFNMRII